MDSEHLDQEIEAAIDQLVQVATNKAGADGIPAGLVLERLAKRFVRDENDIDDLWHEAISDLLSLGRQRATGTQVIKRASKPPADALSSAALRKLTRKISKLLGGVYLVEALPISLSVFVGLMESLPIEAREEYWEFTSHVLNRAREDQKAKSPLH